MIRNNYPLFVYGANKNMDEYKGVWRRIQSELRIRTTKNTSLSAYSPTFKSYVDLSHLEDFHINRSSHLPSRSCERISYADLTNGETIMLRRSIEKFEINTQENDKEVDLCNKEIKDADAKSTERSSNLLCGYLNKMKLGTKHLTGKTFKRRWFVMADDTCTLLYYSTPRDQIPLGQIEISKSVITFNLDSGLNIFEVRSNDKAVLLQADDTQTMMYWIQNLQKKRKKFFLLKELMLNSEEPSLVNSSEFQSIIKKIDRPTRTVGESAASVGNDLSRNRSFRDISISKLKVEFQNKFNKLKSNTNAPTSTGQSTSNAIAKSGTSSELSSPSSAKPSKLSEDLMEFEANHEAGLQSKGAKIFNFKGKLMRSDSQNSASKKQLTRSTSDNCSDCNRLRGVVEEMKGCESMLSDELMATHVRCRNQQKAMDKLSREFETWKKLMSPASLDIRLEECLREITIKEERIVELEDFVVTMQSELANRNGQISSLKSKLESMEGDYENLKDNLKLKDEMVTFLSDKCFQLTHSAQVSPDSIGPEAVIHSDQTSNLDAVAINSKDSLSSDVVKHKTEPPQPSTVSSSSPTPQSNIFGDDGIILHQGEIVKRRERSGQGSTVEPSRATKSEISIPGCHESTQLQHRHSSGEFLREKQELMPSLSDCTVHAKLIESKSADTPIHDVKDNSNRRHDNSNYNNLVNSCDNYSNNDLKNDTMQSNSSKETSVSGSWTVYTGDMVASEVRSMEKKEDEQMAYKLQNQMLNQEILDLNEILVITGERLDKSQIRITQLEAKCYQLQAKHIKCLDDALAHCSDEDPCDALKKIKLLIEKALIVEDFSDDAKMQRSILEGSDQAYDQYGFEKNSNQQLVSSRFSDHNTSPLKPNLSKSRTDLNLFLRWDMTLISLERGTSRKNDELKMMVREGVPNQFRGRLWKICIDFLLQEYRNNSIVKSYSSLLDMVNSKSVVMTAANQIELDLLRTLPNNKHFSNLSSSKITSLRNILLAFSILNPEVGYCQGLNRLVAILLLFLNEEESFWGLVAIVEVILPPKYYSHTLIAAHADQRVLKEFVHEKLPILMNHFSQLSFDLSLFTFSWFLTAFVDNVPVNTFLRIWDTFLFEGSKVLFRYAVAIMKYYEDQMLSHKTAAEMNMFVRNMCEGLHDIDRLGQIAFNELNPFSMKKVTNKRNIHLQKLTQELQELDKLRHSFESSLSHKPLEFKKSNASNVSSDDNDC